MVAYKDTLLACSRADIAEQQALGLNRVALYDTPENCGLAGSPEPTALIEMALIPTKSWCFSTVGRHCRDLSTRQWASSSGIVLLPFPDARPISSVTCWHVLGMEREEGYYTVSEPQE